METVLDSLGLGRHHSEKAGEDLHLGCSFGVCDACCNGWVSKYLLERVFKGRACMAEHPFRSTKHQLPLLALSSLTEHPLKPFVLDEPRSSKDDAPDLFEVDMTNNSLKHLFMPFAARFFRASDHRNATLTWNVPLHTSTHQTHSPGDET
eukprot:CAMPEP_0119328086 /NCGR_PEP_ID=MMETSP1333-20130426/72411_1 /TAXON_ID=418940 /ORGANISM="Scyphosphaera apsteinii, Strain RCC1455" /LENGTH=149 /DNA_ID=CAMNT_0007336847 /DNA_START=381 /DNA_END=830 /DNA_ORIENTATION=+